METVIGSILFAARGVNTYLFRLYFTEQNLVEVPALAEGRKILESVNPNQDILNRLSRYKDNPTESRVMSGTGYRVSVDGIGIGRSAHSQVMDQEYQRELGLWIWKTLVKNMKDSTVDYSTKELPAATEDTIILPYEKINSVKMSKALLSSDWSIKFKNSFLDQDYFQVVPGDVDAIAELINKTPLSSKFEKK
jgi:hypothetical protein